MSLAGKINLGHEHEFVLKFAFPIFSLVSNPAIQIVLTIETCLYLVPNWPCLGCLFLYDLDVV